MARTLTHLREEHRQEIEEPEHLPIAADLWNDVGDRTGAIKGGIIAPEEKAGGAIDEQKELSSEPGARHGVVDTSFFDDDTTEFFFAQAAERPFTKDLVRGNLCAFIAARADEVEQWEVTVMSIVQFVPGMRVAVAAEGEDGVAAFERCV